MQVPGVGLPHPGAVHQHLQGDREHGHGALLRRGTSVHTQIFLQNKRNKNDDLKGFQRVLNNLTGEFAFIHDASEVKYQYYQNCNLTEIGEPFAEQPYAIAIQQGSHLHDEISKVILELQKDRYFESLKGRLRALLYTVACY